jgi:hypothetical protein
VEAGGIELQASIENTQVIDFPIAPMAQIASSAQLLARFGTVCNNRN